MHQYDYPFIQGRQQAAYRREGAWRGKKISKSESVPRPCVGLRKCHEPIGWQHRVTDRRPAYDDDATTASHFGITQHARTFVRPTPTHTHDCTQGPTATPKFKWFPINSTFPRCLARSSPIKTCSPLTILRRCPALIRLCHTSCLPHRHYRAWPADHIQSRIDGQARMTLRRFSRQPMWLHLLRQQRRVTRGRMNRNGRASCCEGCLR